MRMTAAAVALVSVAWLAAPPALAQQPAPPLAPPPPPPTMFERYPAIATACLPAEKIAWTEEACAYILGQIKTRAEALKLKVAVLQPGLDFASSDIGPVEGVPGVNAIRAPVVFKAMDGEPAGRVRFVFDSAVMISTVSSTRMRLDDAGAVTSSTTHAFGRRTAIPFLPGQLTIEPTTKFEDAKPFVDSLLELFFKAGERLAS